MSEDRKITAGDLALLAAENLYQNERMAINYLQEAIWIIDRISSGLESTKAIDLIKRVKYLIETGQIKIDSPCQLNPAPVPSADIVDPETFASKIHFFTEHDGCKKAADLIDKRDAAQRQAGREDMREILNEAMEAMDERRCYLDIWEWKYGKRWDREDIAIREALRDLDKGSQG